MIPVGVKLLLIDTMCMQRALFYACFTRYVLATEVE